MQEGVLGKTYEGGDTIIRQGDPGDCMYVVQSGKVEVFQRSADAGQQRLAVLESGEFFGEMALFEREVRSATVRALGDARVLKVDKKTLLRRIKEDPLLAVNMLRAMSRRVRELNAELTSMGRSGGAP